MKCSIQEGFGDFIVDTNGDVYREPAKQILVVLGGVTFFSLPIGPCEARHVMRSVKNAAPNSDPMIVVAN